MAPLAHACDALPTGAGLMVTTNAFSLVLWLLHCHKSMLEYTVAILYCRVYN